MAIKKVLITGAAGFIGSNLCAHFLGKGYTVRGLDNFATGRKDNLADIADNPKFEFIEGDIRKQEVCSSICDGIDAVLHQAALGSVPRSIDDPQTTNSVNITGFLNMLVAARDANVERFIYAASSSTYGDLKELPKVEDRIGMPLSPYAVTKYVNELYAHVFASLYGMKVIGLRYFNVFGRHQDPQGAYAAAIPKFIQAFIDHRSPIIHGDGEQTRDFTYIDNVLNANEVALTVEDEGAFNQVYNIAYGERTSVNEIVKKLQHLLSEKDEEIGKVEITYGAKREGDVMHSLASVDKARRLLGYDPNTSVIEGLEMAIDWYWNNLK